MTAEIKDGNLVITIPIQNPLRPSASGKTLLVATTGGNVQSNAVFDGKPITIGLNAWIKK